MSSLTVRDLHASYGAVRVLHGITFDVADGGITVVLGANGAGKTTTLRAVCGQVAASGSVELDDRQVLGMNTSRIARLGVAHVPEGRGTFSELSVLENLRLGGYARSGRDQREDLDQVFEWFPRLYERQTQQAGSLSGGEQQMLALARALMMRPRLMLLDEPSQGLAPGITRELFGRLPAVQARYGTTMLIVEQNAHLALEIADRAFVLEAGRVVFGGDANEVKADDTVRRAYLG